VSTVSAASLVAFTCGLCFAVSGCGSSKTAPASTAAPRTPGPASEVALTPNEKKVWAPLPPDRSEIPVLLYHGIGPATDYSNSSDAAYGVGEADFA
jgi:hypothetical protein